jgi:hypothetical protein
MAPTSTTPEFSREEVGLAHRNPGMLDQRVPVEVG